VDHLSFSAELIAFGYVLLGVAMLVGMLAIHFLALRLILKSGAGLAISNRSRDEAGA